MRVALFTDTYPPEINGVATSSQTLANALIQNGNQVLVVTTNSEGNTMTYKDGIIRIPGAELKKMYGYRLAGFYNKEAMKIVRKFNPEVVHCQTEFGIGWFSRIVARRLDIPLVYTYHTMYEDYTYYITKGHLERIAKSFMRNYVRMLISHATCFITPSSKTKDYMRRIGIDKYANVIPTGVDFNKFFPENIDKNVVLEIKKKHGIDPNKFTLLSLGRIAQEKSIDFCIRGFAQFLKDHPEAKAQMVIVGTGPAVEELKELAKKLGHEKDVIFTGPCPPSEVQNYYALGNAFASASLSETQGLTYMEAMAAHLYVLARFDHNLLDVISNGNTGYFFENEEEFSKKLMLVYEMYQKKDTKMLEDAITSIDNYSLNTFYNRILEVYRRAIKEYW